MNELLIDTILSTGKQQLKFIEMIVKIVHYFRKAIILLKDLYIAKSGIIVTLTALFVLAFGLSFLLDASSILMLAPAISTVAVYMSITNDASSKWNKNVITMPVSRDQIIGAKYILYLLLSAIGIIVVLASLGIMSLLGMTITLYSLLFNAAIGISAALFAGGISLPCVYFFDAEKSQIVYMIAFVASTGIITALVLLINLFIPVKDNILLAFYIVLAISFVCFAVSYKITTAVYRKQDII